eukprot:466035-Amphidinium_carterae.1
MSCSTSCRRLCHDLLVLEGSSASMVFGWGTDSSGRLAQTSHPKGLVPLARQNPPNHDSTQF